MGRAFEVRGVIEGFYGPPWTWEARREVVGFLAARGMNAYVYAPKDDPRHRARWREPYPPEELDRMVSLARHCREHGVRFGFALSPALDFEESRDADWAALRDKLEPLARAGVDWFVLAFDDITPAEGAGATHARITRWVGERLAEVGGEARLSVVPTDYVGTCATRYLEELCATLPEQVDLVWTGPTVVSPTITAGDARARAAATGGRPPLLWDNYPVNDVMMAGALHLGPLVGRDPALAELCSGFLANPMLQARASMVPLATVADFTADPDGYEPEASWHRAVADVGGPAAPALEAVAAACSTSALHPPHTLPLHRLIDRVEGGDAAALSEIRLHLEAARDAGGALPEALVAEVGPWTHQLALEAGVGLAAVDLLEKVTRGADLADLTAAAFLVLGAWRPARAGEHVVFGPRYACYPALVQLPAGLRLDVGEALVEDASAIDRLCRVALGAYRDRT